MVDLGCVSTWSIPFMISTIRIWWYPISYRCYIPIYNSWSNGPIYSALCLTSPRISQVDVPLWRPLPASSAVVRRERLVREARLHSLPLSKFSTINRVTLSKDNSMVPHVPRFSLADVMRLFFFLVVKWWDMARHL